MPFKTLISARHHSSVQPQCLSFSAFLFVKTWTKKKNNNNNNENPTINASWNIVQMNGNFSLLHICQFSHDWQSCMGFVKLHGFLLFMFLYRESIIHTFELDLLGFWMRSKFSRWFREQKKKMVSMHPPENHHLKSHWLQFQFQEQCQESLGSMYYWLK